MNSSSIIDFFVTNWYNALSLVLSLTALIVAIQANIYARKNSSPTLSIKDNKERAGQKSNSYWQLNLLGCFRKSIRAYEFVFRVPGEFWITNSGGMDATLVDVSFVSGLDRFLNNRFDSKWYIEMYEHTNPYTKGDVIFDLNVPSGTTVPIYITAISYAVSFQTKEEALKFADDLQSSASCRWYFRFGDGTTLVRSFKKMFSSGRDGFLERNLDVPCDE